MTKEEWETECVKVVVDMGKESDVNFLVFSKLKDRDIDFDIFFNRGLSPRETIESLVTSYLKEKQKGE